MNAIFKFKQCLSYIACTQLANRGWFSVVCTLIDNDMRRHFGQNVLDSRGTTEWVHNRFWLLWWCVLLSIRRQTTLNHIRIVFYHNTKVKENVFFRVRAEKGIAWHIDAGSVVWTLIKNDKSDNQIAKLAAIVVKNKLLNFLSYMYSHVTP